MSLLHSIAWHTKKSLISSQRIIVTLRYMIFLFASLPLAQLYADESSLEYKIKAGYLYNFTKFIDWPIEQSLLESQNLNICLLGDNKFNDILNPIELKKTKGKSIHLLHFDRISEDVAQCQILFVGDSKIHRFKQIFLYLNGYSVLTVGNTEDFALSGGMIGFVIDAGRVRLRINRTAAKEAGLNISAKLLEVADIVSTSE